MKFADDTKCFKSIATLSDCDHLQEDITALFTWYADSDLYFNLKKFVHLFFKCKFNTIHTMSDILIPHVDHHKDHGLLLSEDLSWDKHYKFIISHACKTLGLIHCTFTSNQLPATLTKLYIPCKAQLLYYTQLWRPHLIKVILSLEQIQCRATKYILNDYTIC